MSDIRIISGEFKNFKLKTPNSFDVRPTSVRARKALFDSLGDFDDLKIIDICSGVGSLALEAASRGAKEVLCLELNRIHCQFIEENFSHCNYKNFTVRQGDVVKYLNFDKFEADVIFADPPYCESARIFSELSKNESFCKALEKSTLIWEMPSKMEDFIGFAEVELFSKGTLKIFDNVKFLFI